MTFRNRVSAFHILVFIIVAGALFLQSMFRFPGQSVFMIACIVALALIQTSLALFVLWGGEETFLCWRSSDPGAPLPPDDEQPGAAPAA